MHRSFLRSAFGAAILTRRLFRLRTTVAILTLVLVWATSATSVAAANPGHAAPANKTLDWLGAADPTELLVLTDGVVQVSPSADVPTDYAAIVALAADGLNRGVAAGIYTVDDQFAVNFTKEGRGKARADIESMFGGCVKASDLTVSWLGVRARTVNTCQDGQPGGGSLDPSVTIQASPLGCGVSMVGFILAAVALVLTPLGILFWLTLGSTVFAWIGIVDSCLDVITLQAQKINGWRSCRLTFRVTTRETWDCNPWPWW